MSRQKVSILLVEDNKTQAIFITKMLMKLKELDSVLVHATTLKDATSAIQSDKQFDVILLDLSLPDSDEMLTVASMRSASIGTPIVVITSIEDRQIMINAIKEGVHDYLIKKNLNSFELSRAILFSIDRQKLINDREELIRELDAFNDRLQEELQIAQASNEALAGWRHGSVTAKMAGVGSLQDRLESEFDEIVIEYESILDEYLEALGFGTTPPRVKISALAKRIGESGSGPQDIIDIHLEVVHNMSVDNNPKRVKVITTEGRLLALEVMGNLVDYYRQGLVGKLKTKERD